MGLLDAILVVVAAAAAPAFGPDSGPVRSVFVFRHCLRSTPTSAYGAEGYTDFNNYSGPQPGHAFPAWPVPVYQCLPEGKEVVQSMGEQLNATIPGQLTVMVDTSAQRDNDTALALLAGMGRPPTYTAAPEYFSPTKAGVCAALPTADAVAALKARFAAFPVPDGHSARLSALQAVLGAGVAPALNDIPDYVSSSAYLTGGTAVASAFAEAFLMELGGGLPVAWGGATEDAVYDFLATHIYYRSVQDRVFSKVQRSHSYMARSIVEFLFADVGREATPRESPREASLAFIGHDGDLDALAEMFGLQWHARPFPPNSTTL